MKRLCRRVAVSSALLAFALSTVMSFGAVTQSTKVFTAADVSAMFKEFDAQSDPQGRNQYKVPDYYTIIATFGKPLSRKVYDERYELRYPFGLFRVYTTWDSMELTIENDQLVGPRGTKVGDSFKDVITRFRDTRKNKSIALSKKYPEIILYEQGENPRYTASLWLSDSNLGFIDYCQTNELPMICRVLYCLDAKQNVKEIRIEIESLG